MREKKPHCKGLRVPRLFIFLHGFFNGRFKTGDVDRENHTLHSAYIHSHLFLYGELCRKEAARLEQTLSPAFTEAEGLLLELECLPAPPELPGERGWNGTLPESMAEAQSCRLAVERSARASVLRDQAAERRRQILERLLVLRDQIATRERVCAEDLGAVAEALMSRFCTYGHGVLLRPVRAGNIPAVGYAGYLEGYFAGHDRLRRRLEATLNGKEHGDVGTV